MKKQQVFYIHGGSAYSNYEDFLKDLQDRTIRELPWLERRNKWSATLADSLGVDYEVFTPTMPNKQNAKYAEWKIWFERYFEHLHEDVVLVGCSLGAYFIVKYLTENTIPVNLKAVIIMAAPFENFQNTEISRERGGDFEFSAAHITKLQEQTKQVYILHSKDDFVVPYDHALQYKKALPEAELMTFEDKNHFLVEELPELVDLIKKI